MTEQPIRVGVWCAVSSKPQADTEKESLPAQETAGRDFAQALGGEVVKTYTVPGHSRDYWNWYEAEKEMPAYRQVREDLENSRLDVIHTIDADRLGRDPALIQQFYSLAERHGCEVYDASMPHTIGQQSIGHRYGTAVKSVAAGEDQRRRVQRQKMGMKGRIKRGLPSGLWPYGYEPVRDGSGEVVAGRFTRDIEAVRLLTRWFLDGDSYDMMLRQISLTPYTPSGGGNWHYTSTWRIMQNDTYAGLVSWGPWKAETPSDKFPALWDPDTYRAIVRERTRRSDGQFSHPRSSPLRGVAFCHRCGGPMGSKHQLLKDGTKATYLRCSRHASGCRTGFRCHYNSIPLAEVLKALDTWIASFATVEAIEEAIAETPDQERVQGDLARAEDTLDDLHLQQRRLALAYARGSMSIVVYHDASAELGAQVERAERQVASLRQELAALPSQEERLEAARAVFQRYSQELARADPQQARRGLIAAGVEIRIEDNAIQWIGFRP